jgi:sulfur dioxygenase
VIFRQLFDPSSSTYTYLLADPATREAVLIDPVFEQVGATRLIAELGLALRWTLETHVHADHVTGAWLLRERSAAASRLRRRAARRARIATCCQPGEKVAFGHRHLEARATPGHTGGCTTYVFDDRSMAFTGDTLLIRGCGRTDFQQGNRRRCSARCTGRFFRCQSSARSIRGTTIAASPPRAWRRRSVQPAPRGEGILEQDFVGYMRHLGLPHPRQMEVAVPANLQCGRPAQPAGSAPDWTPATYTFAGFWEVQPNWLEEHLREVEIIDVREADEFNGPLGHVPGAKLLPLGELAGRLDAIGRDRPVVLVCRSGARSAQATVMLGKAGFARVANLSGGMLRWRALRLPVEGGTD